MTHNIVTSLLNYISAQEYMSEKEYDNVSYTIELLLVNFFKTLQLILFSLFFNVFIETLMMNLPYCLLRVFAGGWHAKKSLNCSMFGIGCFVGIPVLVKHFDFSLNNYLFLLITIVQFICILAYAPADTENNPLVNVRERQIKKVSAAFMLSLLLAFSFFQNPLVRTLIMFGITTEVIILTPAFYKITNRSFNNYEKYKQEN